MPMRRTLPDAAPAVAAPLIGSLAASISPGAARAQTPRAVSVMAKRIDDIISLDPAEGFDHSGNKIDGNAHRCPVDPDSLDPRHIRGDLAEARERGPDGLTYTFRLRRADPAITAARAALDEADADRCTAAYLDLQRRVQRDGSCAILPQT